MDDTALISGLLAARMGEVQLAVAATLVRMNTDTGASVEKLVDAARQNMNRLANVAAGVGTHLDVTA